MGTRLEPLVCELHAHTRWSDGELSVAELVDLHGRSGIDVLCVTDHVVRRNDPWREIDGALLRSVEASGWTAYLSEIEREAKRAWGMYGMRLLPGLELTFNDVEPVKAAHAVALGLRTFVSVENGIGDAMKTAARSRRRRHRRAPVRRLRARIEEPATDSAIRARPRAARARAPLRAVQPDAALRLGG
jgi:hypothetical protein